MKPEYKIISDIILENTRVLDVGCNDGSFMEFVKKNKDVDIRGIEISKEKVQTCVSKGLTVIEGDAEFDLKQFPDKSFDYVVLGQTLQAFINPEIVIKEGVVSEEIIKFINEDKKIRFLVLAASDQDNPGPLVSLLAGQRSGKLPVPTVVIPAGLSSEEIDDLASRAQ